jgi:hypothetical protein
VGPWFRKSFFHGFSSFFPVAFPYSSLRLVPRYIRALCCAQQLLFFGCCCCWPVCRWRG